MTFASVLVHGMIVLLLFFLLLQSFRALLLLCAIPELWSHWRLSEDKYFHMLLGSDALPPVSIVTTTHNGGEEAVRTARALLNLQYPRHEVVLVNDGSTDGTLEFLTEAFDLTRVSPAFTVSIPTRPVRGYYRSQTYTRLLVIDKEPGGVADAMNAGLNASHYPYALTAGASILFEPDALLRLTRPFLLNKSVCAVAGVLRIANGGHLVDHRFIPAVPLRWGFGMRTVEVLRTFLFERLGWNRIASNLIFPGSVALVRRDHLLMIGGFHSGVETPGTDLMVRLQRSLTDRGVNALMLVIPDLVAWTIFSERPVSAAQARGSRYVRQRGLGRILLQHRGVCLNPEYGAFGMIAIPYYWALFMFAPALELLGYLGGIVGWVTGTVPHALIWAYLATVPGYGMLLSVWTVILETLTNPRYPRRGEIFRLLLYAFAEPFGYRQTTAWLRVRAFFTTRSPHQTHG